IVYFLLYVYFFFSSRRRHTRFSRDWSSDVCSSDLQIGKIPLQRCSNIFAVGIPFYTNFNVRAKSHLSNPTSPASLRYVRKIRNRSEERRVGKECRYRRSQ